MPKHQVTTVKRVIYLFVLIIYIRTNMAIIKTEIIKGVKTYTVKKDMSDTEADKKLANKFVTASMIKIS